jgi:ketopantoate hydroxymethyltransferase
MSSWLRGAFEKVKEKGAAVKGIAKDVAHRTKEVRTRLIGASTTSDLQVRVFHDISILFGRHNWRFVQVQ